MRCLSIIFTTALIFITTTQQVRGNPSDFQRIISGARDNCTGIYDRLSKIKSMATANTVVTGVGTLAGGGALFAGISKSKIDKQAEELEKQLEQIEQMSDKEFFRFLKRPAEYEEALNTYQDICAQKKSLEAQSKQLGNIRTGLMAGNTATAIAGTIIANKNKNDSKTIAEHVSECLKTIEQIPTVMGQARINGETQQYEKLKRIYDSCGKMYTKNLEKISNNSNVAMISSAVNIGTGTAGTITSAIANTDGARHNNQKKNLNTAANVLAGTSTVASGISTVFNALTLKAVNNNLNAAKECEEALH